MRQRQRKAWGTAFSILSLIIWAALGMWAYELFLLDAPTLVHLAFFVLFGLAWIFPAMAIIRWMSRPDA